MTRLKVWESRNEQGLKDKELGSEQEMEEEESWYEQGLEGREMRSE